MSKKLVFFMENSSSCASIINLSEVSASTPVPADQAQMHEAPLYEFTSRDKHASLNNMNTPNDSQKNLASEKIRILHIEDDEEIRFLVRIFLREVAELDTVESAEKALEILPQSKYHLIITDIDLGAGLDGIEVTRLIRSMDEYRNIPVVAATAYGSDSIRNQCRDAGMHAILLKPFLKKDLLHILGQIIHHENEKKT